MGLTNYGSRTTTTTANGSTITTSKSADGSVTTKTVHSSDGTFIKGDVYRGDLNGPHSHFSFKDGKTINDRGVSRSDVFKK